MWAKIEKVRARLLQWLHWVKADDILIMTLTFKDREISAAEAQKRFHSLWTNLFSKKVAGAYFCVLQYQRVRWWVGEHYGTPHYHLIIVWPGIRNGCWFHPEGGKLIKSKRTGERVRAGEWTAGPELAQLEALFADKHEEYGFGPQHRFEPLRNDHPVKAAVSYIVGYLQKGIEDAVARPIARVVSVDGVELERTVTPRSYRFGRNVLKVGKSETTLGWGCKRRGMIKCYCDEYDLTFDEFGYEIDRLYGNVRSFGWATKLFWQERVTPLWELRKWCPF